MKNIYQNIKRNNPNKERKILIIIEDMIADMISAKNIDLIVFVTRYQDKLYIPFYYENFKQTRASANCI